MSPLRLMPRDERFTDLFIADGENLAAAADALLAMVTEYDDLDTRVARIRELEHEGDRIGDELVDRLERAFITPFDREDIHELSSRLDDVVDRIQEIAETFLLYHVQQPTPEAKVLAGLLAQQGRHLVEALRRTESLKDLDAPLRAVHDLENQADRESRAAIASLFQDGADALEVIKWRDIYRSLEEAIDAAEDAAEVVERMVHKAT
ncbi:MAG: DUF47 family protein [Chloroflexi bacterium]|nr:DUF47 family protein [Chloroflexota bacterium]